MPRTEYQKRWYAANRERERAKMRERYRRNREKILADRRLTYDPARKRAWDIRRKYGLTAEECDQLLAGGCHICGDAAEVIDHDHGTSIVRGALCGNCNRGLGFFRDDPLRLVSAVAYLSK